MAVRDQWTWQGEGCPGILESLQSSLSSFLPPSSTMKSALQGPVSTEPWLPGLVSECLSLLSPPRSCLSLNGPIPSDSSSHALFGFLWQVRQPSVSCPTPSIRMGCSKARSIPACLYTRPGAKVGREKAKKKGIQPPLWEKRVKTPELPLGDSRAQESVQSGRRGVPASCEHCQSLQLPGSLFLHVPVTPGPLLSPLCPPRHSLPLVPWPPGPLG